MSKTEVFKIQRPMASSVPGMTVGLIYNKSRSKQFQMVLGADILKMMGSNYKIYVNGTIENKMLNIIGSPLDASTIDW